MHGQQNDKYTEMQGQQNDKYTEMHGQQNDKYTEMHGQQNDKFTEMHGQQNDKYTEMHGQLNISILCRSFSGITYALIYISATCKEKHWYYLEGNKSVSQNNVLKPGQ